MGAREIIPGVSGGSVAVMPNIYGRLIESISHLRRDFKKASAPDRHGAGHWGAACRDPAVAVFHLGKNLAATAKRAENEVETTVGVSGPAEPRVGADRLPSSFRDPISMPGDDAVDKYKKLLSNTLIFAIGTFSSKLLVFFLTRLYTAVLTQEEYGIVDMIQQSGNLLLPLVTLGITNAVVRFDSIEALKKKATCSPRGFLSIGAGFLLLMLLSPLLGLFDFLSGHVYLLCSFVLTSSLRSPLCPVRAGQRRGQAVRARRHPQHPDHHSVQYPVSGCFPDGRIRLHFFHDLFRYPVGAVFVRHVQSAPVYPVPGLDRNIAKSMLLFSIPLIPNTILWWITNMSDRYIISMVLGAAFYRIIRGGV